MRRPITAATIIPEEGVPFWGTTLVTIGLPILEVLSTPRRENQSLGVPLRGSSVFVSVLLQVMRIL